MTTLTIAQFRADFPEFGGTDKFPNAQVQYWMTLSTLLMNVSRWGSLYFTGQELFIAHHCSIEAHAMEETKNGGIPGKMAGAISGKSVGGVSVSYDTGSTIEPNAGHWGLTIYGNRFVQLMRMVGAGPIQLGAGFTPAFSGQAWPGPWTGFLPSPSN